MKKLRATMAFVLASVLIMTNMVFASDTADLPFPRLTILMLQW